MNVPDNKFMHKVHIFYQNGIYAVKNNAETKHAHVKKA